MYKDIIVEQNTKRSMGKKVLREWNGRLEIYNTTTTATSV